LVRIGMVFFVRDTWLLMHMDDDTDEATIIACTL